MSLATPSAQRSAALRGLLWREWLAHRSLVLGLLAGWLACGVVLEIFFHPGFIIAFGTVAAFAIGPVFGGGDAAEGSEEFAFALPPTRGERYVARLALGGGAVVGLCVLGTLTIALDVPQALWGLVVDSGFTRPFPSCRPRCLYALAIAVPTMVFACSFALAAVSRAGGLVWASWLLAGLAAGAVVGLGFLGEFMLWRDVNGYVTVPALLALSPLALLGGYLAYVRKEGVSRPRPAEGGGLWWVWVVAVLAVLMVLALMMLAWRATPDPPPSRRPMDTVAQPAEVPAPPSPRNGGE